MNEIWCSRFQGKMSRWLMFSNWGARCWKPQEDSNSDEWTLTCRSMSSGNSLTQIGPNSRKMCLKMLKKAWFIHDKDVDLTDSICTCKTPPKTGSFGRGEMILMRALHSSAPDRHRHVGHSPVPGVSVWNTGARCTRKRIRVQKGFLLPFADANDGVSSPMIGVWLWACPLKKKCVKKHFLQQSLWWDWCHHTGRRYPNQERRVWPHEDTRVACLPLQISVQVAPHRWATEESWLGCSASNVSIVCSIWYQEYVSIMMYICILIALKYVVS